MPDYKKLFVTDEEIKTLKSAINDVDIKKYFPDITDQDIVNLINILTKNNYESLNNSISNKGGDMDRDLFGNPGDGVSKLQKQLEQSHAEEEKKLNLLHLCTFKTPILRQVIF
jgi:hypothetical protein